MIVNLYRQVIPFSIRALVYDLFLGKILSKIRSLQREPSLEQKKNFYSQFVKEGELCYDIGANIGDRVEIFLAIKAKVVAVEPQPQCVLMMKDRFGPQNITYIPKGLGAEKTVLDMFVCSEDLSISSFSEEFVNKTKVDRLRRYEWENNALKVEIDTLDNIIQEYALPVFVKIDVEGFECEVLKGLSSPVNALSFEITLPELSSNAISCIERINTISPHYEYNYSIGESMKLKCKKWLSSCEIISFIESVDENSKLEHSDIYARLKK